jgi:histidinol-phosphate phosphatase family protein
LSKIEDYVIHPSVPESIKILNEENYKVIMITNQSGLGRGLFSKADLNNINDRLSEDIIDGGGFIDDIFFCPHLPLDNCECRKPKSGMLEMAHLSIGIDFPESYIVGDTLNDLISGFNVGCKTVLVLTGYGKDEIRKIKKLNFSINYVAKDFKEATEWIVNDS